MKMDEYKGKKKLNANKNQRLLNHVLGRSTCNSILVYEQCWTGECHSTCSNPHHRSEPHEWAPRGRQADRECALPFSPARDRCDPRILLSSVEGMHATLRNRNFIMVVKNNSKWSF